MKKWLAVLTTLGWVGLQSASAQLGQYQPPVTNPQPAFSPYLNMNRGNNPAINYFGIVQPQINTGKAISQLQMDARFGQAGLTPLGVGVQVQNNFLITGHPVTFQNLSHYFPQGNSQFAGFGGAGGVGPGGYGAGMGGFGAGGLGTGGIGVGVTPTIANTPLPQGFGPR